MLGRQPVRVTYAHKRGRAQNANKLQSSPLEVLPPEVDDLTYTQMARRMLKRSRRASLAEQLEDKNVEHIREHLAKRIKRTQECVSNVDPTGVPSDMPLQDDITFQTPFPSSRSLHESGIAKPSVPEQLSPVPVAKRVVCRTNSRNLKENVAHSILASPFSSRPGSAASSPKHKGRARPSRRLLRSSLHAKSRTLSGIFKENIRRLPRKGSTVSLKDTIKEPPARHIKHRRYPSSPSTSYMRSQFAQEDWIAPPKALSRTFYGYDEIPSPGEFHSDASFYTDRPQSYSTPAISRLRKLPGAGTDNFSPSKDSADASDRGVEMMDGTVPLERQAIHLSENSIFSSSDEFTIGSLPAMKLPATNNGGTTVEKNNSTCQDKALARVARQAYRETVERSQAGHTLAGSFIAEYDIPLSDPAYSPVSTAATKILGAVGVPKLFIGKQRSTSARGKTLIRTSRDLETLIPPASSPKTAVSCPPCPPSSPASDLALDFRSMDICGDPDTHSDGETCRLPASISLQMRSGSLRDALTESTTKKSLKGWPARSRAGTIRAADFPKPGVSSSDVALVLTGSSLLNVRRTRSGTVVGPDSKLATKGVPITGLAAVHSGSEPESDDELLLKAPWIEDLEYLGLAAPRSRKDAEPDEMNLGGMCQGSESGPPRRLGLRRRG